MAVRDPGTVLAQELGEAKNRSVAVDSGVKPGTFLQFWGNSYQPLSSTLHSATGFCQHTGTDKGPSWARHHPHNTSVPSP